MMIDRRLAGLAGGSRRYIAGNVLAQWVALAANIAMMAAIAGLLAGLYAGTAGAQQLARTAAVAAAAVAVRYACTLASSRMSELSGRTVKRRLRAMLYEKLLRLGSAAGEQVRTSEVVQVAVEGVDQLETVFGAYLPQLFYAVLAPLTLFAVLAPVNAPAALALLVCVPLIPISIAAVQTWAKKLLGQYWGQYTALGDTFLENLQGLTTLKIYQADAMKHEEMNAQAEQFRRITMRVLTMQLNSISIMDLVAYGGAALGAVLAVTQLRAGHVSLAGCLMILLLSADFFLPMRQLGSFFHIAMNGMAASERIFRLLDLPEPQKGQAPMPQEGPIRCRGLRFAYEAEREVLHGIDLDIPRGSLTAIVGKSGCGKSTVAAILMGRRRGYEGDVTVGGVPLQAIDEAALLRGVTYVGHQSYLFKGTVRDNLCMARPDADDEALWAVLERVKLGGFLRGEQGLDTPVAERGENLSGGQRQRLALARALLHDSPIYIFDEATSNVDVESENDIMAEIHRLAGSRTVILITHRLANAVPADRIVVMEDGCIAESGTHAALMAQEGAYARLYRAQQALERYSHQKEENAAQAQKEGMAG